MSNHDMDESNDESLMRCPFCNSTESCPHFLLVVDVTFRNAEGGPLLDSFNARWGQIHEMESDNPSFDEGEAFDSLLDEVDDLADAQAQSSQDSAPGLSSAYVGFYASTVERAARVVAKYCNPQPIDKRG